MTTREGTLSCARPAEESGGVDNLPIVPTQIARHLLPSHSVPLTQATPRRMGCSAIMLAAVPVQGDAGLRHQGRGQRQVSD